MIGPSSGSGMVVFRALGSTELSGPDGEELLSILSRPKLLGLLSYLAADSSGPFHRRDTLMGLFWAETDPERSRNALRQSLYHLRRALGEGVLSGRGDDEVGLDRERFWCDVAAFEAAIESGGREEALELYRGELLPGFYVSNAPEHERWLDGRRASLREKATVAAWSLAEEAEAGGDAAAAGRWARRAVGVSPLDEGLVQRVIELLDRHGHRSGAVQEYAAFAGRLAEELDLEPAPETRALVEAVRSRRAVERTGAATPTEVDKPTGAAEPTGKAEATGTAEVTAEDARVSEPSPPPQPGARAARFRSRVRNARLPRVLLGYLPASFIILEATALFTDQFGLPDWVFPGALVLVALALPVLVGTALAQSVPDVAHEELARRGRQPLPSVRRSEPVKGFRRWLTWRRAIGGLVVSLGLWGLLVAGYMVMQMLGIGPGSNLIASGLLEERERVVLADFANHSPDSLLGGAVTEALRVDLAQSPAIRLMSPNQVHEAIARMRRESGASLDMQLAREIALREGVKAVIAGEVNSVGTAYVLSVKLISTESGEELAAYRETADDRASIIDAMDRLSKRLRARIGESLASVRQSRPLPSVTTSSLEALELYARGVELSYRGDVDAAVRFLGQAVRKDTAFAAAYRALSVHYSNEGMPAASQANADQAYRFSSRLPDVERYRTAAAYHGRRGRFDSVAYYYLQLLESSADSVVAANNLGDAYERMGRYEEALERYRWVAALPSPTAVRFLNLASAARTLAQPELADSALAVMIERFPESYYTRFTDAANAWYAGDLPHIEGIASGLAELPHVLANADAARWRAALAAMSGQINRGIALADTAARFYVEGERPYWAYHALLSLQHMASAAARSEAAVPYLDEHAHLIQRDTAPTDAPRFRYQKLGMFANAFALADDLSNARRLLAIMDSLVESSGIQPSGIGEHARAVIALRGRNPEETIEHLRRARAAEYGLLHNYSRLLLADAYAELGRFSEAAAHYDTVSSTYRLNFDDLWLYGVLRPIAHERGAAAFLASGDTTTALRHLGEFLELWSAADPELQPRVQAAQQRLEEILAARG
jgi:DNA-binding SARP family transcriptional activator/tetratricopeptide (TPR) repeat protein